MYRRYLSIIALIAVATVAAAQSDEAATEAERIAGRDSSDLVISPTLGFEYDTSDRSTPSFYAELDSDLESERFSLLSQFYVDNDGRYEALESNQAGGSVFGFYAFLKAGGFEWRPSDNLSFRAGRLEHRDAVEGPYSLFISSVAPSANILQLQYDNEFFFYESRWIELNADSSMYTDAYPKIAYIDGGHTGPFPDRGANYKVYGFKFGDMRFGLQDAAVYVGRSFDPEYLLSPLPYYFTQYVKKAEGRPWAASGNDNNIVGAFWSWDRPDGLSFDAQLLVDDFNVFGMLDTPLNPWKAAWAARARMKTRIGDFSLSHAGALKFTFEPTYDLAGLCYSYTYYPDTRFTVDDPSDRSIAVEDLMIGYKNGENNIAFRLDYSGSWSGFDIASYLEFVLSGAKSPTNAWHDATWHDNQGALLLDDEVLEKLILFNLGVSRRFGSATVSASLLIGGDFNALELSPADTTGMTIKDKYKTINSNSYIWKPGEQDKLIFSAGLFVRYDISAPRLLNILRPHASR